MFNTLVSDRANAFTSRIIQNLAERTGYSHITTTAFRPNSNKAERINSSIASMLSHYCSSSHKDWDLQLSAITLAINTQYNRSIGTTPYNLLYARDCLL